MPNVLAVCCHPNPESYTHAVFAAVCEGLRAHATVQTLDLHAEGFDPVLVVDAEHRRRDLDKVEATRRYREQLRWADAIVLVYPMWWGGMPAMLKGYIDRTFVSGVAYTYEGRPPGATFPEGLMRGKEAHFFYTLDAPWWVGMVDPVWFGSVLAIFWYCGFRRVRRHYLARLKRKTDAERAAWLGEVRVRAARLASRLPR
jgi:NAD(P)H dehydrogenase (quinone)